MTMSLEPFLDAVPDAVVARVAEARCVLVVSHENPDADTIGAAIGIGAIVEAAGGVASLVCTDPVPALYGFIDGVERFRTDPDPDLDYDLLVVCDCGTLDRVGAVATRHPELFARLPRVVIDHHASNSAADPTDWVDPGSAATCEMVALLATRMGVPLGAAGGRLAAALIAGIVMDTATFAHPNTTPRTLAVAAALVDVGAPLAEASRRLYRTKPEAQLRLFGRVLDGLESAAGGRIVHAALRIADFAATGTLGSHSEGIIDLLAQAEDADVAILFKEAPDGATRISVRTRPDGVDATVLTGAFGGGGHARAAGASVAAALDIARPLVLAEAERLLPNRKD